MTSDIASHWDEYNDETAKYFCDMPKVELLALDDTYTIKSQRTEFLKKAKGKGKKFTNDYVKLQKPLHPDLRQAALIERHYQKGCRGTSFEELKEQFGEFRNILYLESNRKEEVKSVDVVFLWFHSGYWDFSNYFPEILRVAHQIKVKWGDDKIAIAMCNVRKYPKAMTITGSKFSYYNFNILWKGKFKYPYRGDVSASSIKYYMEREYRDCQRQKTKQ